MSNSSIWPIDRTLWGTSTLGYSGRGSHGNEGVICILHRSSITGFGWLVGFYGISTFVGYLMPNPLSFATNQFYFKLFSLAWAHSLIVKNISISSYSIYSNSSNSAKYKCRFCLHSVECQNSSIYNNSVLCKYSFNVKNSSISNNSV